MKASFTTKNMIQNHGMRNSCEDIRSLLLYWVSKPVIYLFFESNWHLVTATLLWRGEKVVHVPDSKRAASKLPTCNVLGQALSSYNEVTGLLFQCNQIQTVKGATPNREQWQIKGQAYGIHRSIPNWAPRASTSFLFKEMF